MLFNSVDYLFFFIAVTIVFLSTPSKYKWIPLLLASIYFYSCWRFDYLLLLLATILISYLCSTGMESTNSINRRKFLFTIGLACNFGQLFIFKYYDFTIDNINTALTGLNIFQHFPYLKWALPIGISFHVFQITGYLIDVYKGELKAEKHLGIFALFVCFFPQLVAGPIEKGNHLLPQLKTHPGVQTQDITYGLQLMLWGAIQKIVIADNLATYVNTVFNDLTQYSFFPIVIATFFFTIQVYCDFAGYSLMAKGTARVMGYELVSNFNKPFFSKSLTEFWRKWHISLTTWFTNYIYTPIVINMRDAGKWAPILGVMLIFTLSGLWHGASWAFICYGFVHGIYLSVEILTKKKRKQLKNKTNAHLFNFLATGITFSFVALAFILFRAKDFGQAMSAFKTIFTLNIKGLSINVNYDIGPKGLFIDFMLIILLIALEWLDIRQSIYARFYRSSKSVRWPVYLFAIWLIILFGNMQHQQFIYFQF